jgi:4-amino-4-deoxy-L-arabinose transferase-like glycosyltransferase
VFGWHWADGLLNWVSRHPRIPLAIALVAGVLARLILVVRSNALIDGDEAMVGIQAEHILRGDFPTYFFGQVYMGSLETYLIAGLFRLFGPSPWAMRAVPILLSLLLVYLTWRLAYALLPHESRATPLLAGLAALFAAAPPLYDAVTELRTWGGQIEVYVIILALLLATVELAQRLHAGAGLAELARRWAVWGFLAGLGIWINPLIV